ncbi:hypothetical protein Egran_04403 [Elaphomyces granulatus]|uniref:Uncharacterized protein n=1 Tax=Elaphomyces granulatus TaxID=519963 RepID=A0A232LUK0_9EURO|nr:hypothetical protein Egran_04403 [Elaphomyces granulatus]
MRIIAMQTMRFALPHLHPVISIPAVIDQAVVTKLSPAAPARLLLVAAVVITPTAVTVTETVEALTAPVQ